MGVQRFTESWASSVDDDDDDDVGWCAGGDFSSRLYTYWNSVLALSFT